MAYEDFLSSNTAVSYPFRQNQSLPEELTRAFADACIRADSFDVSLSEFSYKPDDGEIRIVVDGNEYSSINENKKTFVVMRGDKATFVLDSAWLGMLGNYSYTGDAKFEPDCIIVDTTSIESIEIYNGEGDPNNVVLSGDVFLEQGYNTETTCAIPDDSHSDITLLADSGIGLGLVPCEEECEDTGALENGTRLRSENGHVVIGGDECYEVTAKGSTVQIHGKCVACCQCQDYVDKLADVKDTASTVANLNKRITGTATDNYFGELEKFAEDFNAPKIDIRLEISPDGDLMSVPIHGEPVGGFENAFQSFRVTCTIVNLTGLPCYISVPDAWSADNFENLKELFGKATNKDGEELGVPQRLFNGIEAGVICRDFDGNQTKYTINPQEDAYDRKGSLVSSSCKGSTVRRQSTDEVSYVDPNLLTTYVSADDLQIMDTIEACSGLAIRELTERNNPSDRLKFAEETTLQLCPRGTGAGFLMPKGYSIRITNSYMFRAYDSPGDLENSTIFANFYCWFYCPMAGYTAAYNLAKPYNGSYDENEDGNGYSIRYSWKEGDLYKQIVTPEFLRHGIYTTCRYNIFTGKSEISRDVGKLTPDAK